MYDCLLACHKILLDHVFEIGNGHYPHQLLVQALNLVTKIVQYYINRIVQIIVILFRMGYGYILYIDDLR